jgi:tetratricopeptide (TPR) repeat protein
MGLRIETDHMFWTNNFFLGELAGARTHAENGIRCYDPERDHRLTYLYSGHDPGVCCRCFAGLAAWLGGDPSNARRYCEESVELAEQLQHPLTTALAYWGYSYLHIVAGDAEQARQWADRELGIAQRHQFPLFVGQALFQLGWARFRLAERDEGLRQMEDGIDAIRRTGAEMGLPSFIALYAEALSDIGRPHDAARSIAMALDLGRKNGTQLQFGEVLGIEARIKEQLGASANEVETRLRHASAVALSQGSKLGQLRIEIELARRLRAADRESEAEKLTSKHRDLLLKLGPASSNFGA